MSASYEHELVTAIARKLESAAIDHRKCVDSLSRITTHIQFGAPGSVVLLVGPTGSGVTTLTRQVKKHLLESLRPFNPHHVVELQARIPTQKRFAWKQLWESGLEAIDDPLLGQRRRASESVSGLTQFIGTAVFTPTDHIQTDFLNGMHRRQSHVLMVTKAHHIIKGCPESEIETSLEVFQQIASHKLRLPRTVILAGNYNLLKMLHRSAAADFNTEVIHAARFGIGKSDIEGWLEVLKAFEGDLTGIIEPGLLLEHACELLTATRGCIGWLKRILQRAVTAQSRRKDPAITWKQLSKCLPSARTLTKLDEEIAIGEDYFSAPCKATEKHSNDSSSREVSKRRVGERNPAMDALGETPR